jgi:hypothetical protein
MTRVFLATLFIVFSLNGFSQTNRDTLPLNTADTGRIIHLVRAKTFRLVKVDSVNSLLQLIGLCIRLYYHDLRIRRKEENRCCESYNRQWDKTMGFLYFHGGARMHHILSSPPAGPARVDGIVDRIEVARNW